MREAWAGHRAPGALLQLAGPGLAAGRPGEPGHAVRRGCTLLAARPAQLPIPLPPLVHARRLSHPPFFFFFLSLIFFFSLQARDWSCRVAGREALPSQAPTAHPAPARGGGCQGRDTEVPTPYPGHPQHTEHLPISHPSSPAPLGLAETSASMHRGCTCPPLARHKQPRAPPSLGTRTPSSWSNLRPSSVPRVLQQGGGSQFAPAPRCPPPTPISPFNTPPGPVLPHLGTPAQPQFGVVPHQSPGGPRAGQDSDFPPLACRCWPSSPYGSQPWEECPSSSSPAGALFLAFHPYLAARPAGSTQKDAAAGRGWDGRCPRRQLRP